MNENNTLLFKWMMIVVVIVVSGFLVFSKFLLPPTSETNQSISVNLPPNNPSDINQNDNISNEEIITNVLQDLYEYHPDKKIEDLKSLGNVPEGYREKIISTFLENQHTANNQATTIKIDAIEQIEDTDTEKIFLVTVSFYIADNHKTDNEGIKNKQFEVTMFQNQVIDIKER
ncbi:hypothetical protein SAMN05421767_10413 [Granulicatella balaenopterae]|uniref:Uncharacterized protein n=1 Tax=Granulicatella balaenopterae TaxID=137733 RepID=A0A1H9I090_9LACT|nr:hypothetical protein [Granulicatella balaenopterae]SEQ67984.1 hypothetical protein SAMN05421767_10413 [Granulicatella balaenopterae]